MMSIYKKYLWGLLVLLFLLLIPNHALASFHTYQPTEKTSGLVKNPAMGWVLYCDAFAQMTDENFPDDNKCVFDPTLFWEAFDRSGATEKASIFYLRAPWSFFEIEEGKFAWEHDENYQTLIKGALDRDLKLAFRVYVDSQDSWQQATPDYVRDSGAKGYINSYWSPYVNDSVFLDKFSTFITEFGKKYNDASVVDYVDAMGIGWWGEVHNISREYFRPLDESGIGFLTISTQILSAIFQPNHLLFHHMYQPLVKNIDEIMNLKSVNSSLEIITKAYRNSFDEVLLGAQQGGAKDKFSEMLVEQNIYDVLRRDSLGMPKYFKTKDITYYENQMVANGIPLFAENGWNYFAHDFDGYMDSVGNPFSSIRDMLIASLNDAKASRANTFDLRVPEDAVEWMNHEDLVDDFIINGGYRFVPLSFKYTNVVLSDEPIQIKSTWKNSALGKMPNDRPAWNFKYKVAYAFLNQETEEPVFVHETDIDPSEWIKGKDYIYDTKIDGKEIPNGKYDLAYGIVNTTNENIPEINLAILDNKTKTGWHKAGEITVRIEGE